MHSVFTNHRWIALGITNNIKCAIYQQCIYKENLDEVCSSKAFEFSQIHCSGGVEDLWGIIT